MKYQGIVQGDFIDRPNRFIAHVHIDGTSEDSIETVHVKNTGRCKELLIPGARVVLADGWITNPNRKTRYDLITVDKPGIGWINIDSQVPNKVVMEWLKSNSKEKENLFPDITLIKPEYKYGESRVDFFLEMQDRKALIEVKGCTLEVDGVGYFPDAPTTRGVKHLHELTGAIDDGYDSYIAFVIAMPGINKVVPNGVTDPEFEKAFNNAIANKVGILYFLCDVKSDEISCVKVLRV